MAQETPVYASTDDQRGYGRDADFPVVPHPVAGRLSFPRYPAAAINQHTRRFGPTLGRAGLFVTCSG